MPKGVGGYKILHVTQRRRDLVKPEGHEFGDLKKVFLFTEQSSASTIRISSIKVGLYAKRVNIWTGRDHPGRNAQTNAACPPTFGLRRSQSTHAPQTLCPKKGS